jgi:hypothetical protein
VKVIDLTPEEKALVGQGVTGRKKALQLVYTRLGCSTVEAYQILKRGEALISIDAAAYHGKIGNTQLALDYIVHALRTLADK